MNLSRIRIGSYSRHPTPQLQLIIPKPTLLLTPPLSLSLSLTHFVSLSTSQIKLLPIIPITKPKGLKLNKAVSNSNGIEAQIWGDGELDQNSFVYQKTLRLVECSMFAAVVGLAFFLSNSLALENYFGFFFPLPIVISSMRWGIAAGRKNMVATAMLLLVLSDPIKALTYLLTYGLVGLTMGTLWRLGTNWVLSVMLCTFVRAFGAIGYVLISSFLIKENILALITINIHTSLTFIITSLGIDAIPSMGTIYTIFGTLLMLNCGFSMFLLHILYGVLFTKLGLKGSLNLPRWLEKAL